MKVISYKYMFFKRAYRKLSASVLSLNETEGAELLRLSQAFKPPPEGELLDLCSPYGLVREGVK